MCEMVGVEWNGAGRGGAKSEKEVEKDESEESWLLRTKHQ